MEDLKSIKVQLKRFEADFTKQHGRRPGKEDIDSCEDIKGVYKKYYELKIQDAKKQQAADVWGSEFNKKSDKKENKPVADGKETTQSSSSFSNMILEKFQKFASKNNPVCLKNKKQGFGLNLKTGSKHEQSPSADSENVQPMALEQSTEFTKQKDAKESLNVSPTFLFTNETDSKLPNVAFNKLKMTPKWGTNSGKTSHVKRGGKVSVPPGWLRTTDSKDEDDPIDAQVGELKAPKIVDCPGTSHLLGGDTKHTQEAVLANLKNHTPKKTPVDTKQNFSGIINQECLSSGSSHISSHEKNEPSCKKALSQTVVEKPLPNVADNDGDVYDFDDGVNSESKMSVPVISSFREKMGFVGSGVSRGDDVDNIKDDKIVKTVDVDSEMTTKKRKRNSKVEESGSPKSKKSKTSSPSKMPKKTKSSAGPSVGNFVMLNMRSKKYQCKGVGGQAKGGKYKRQQWKERQKKSGCFHCGGDGHWANKCPKKVGERFGGEELDNSSRPSVKDEDFPSIRQAIGVSQGINPPGSGEKDQEMTAEEIEATIIRAPYEIPEVPPAMEPLLAPSSSDSEVPDLVTDALHTLGFQSFRLGQEKAVMRILSGLSTLVVISTGGGKSLCYQLAAYLYAQRSKCITLVISPLVSLMEDQITGLPNGLKGACYHTNMSETQRKNVLERVKAGDVHFLLLSPESLVGGGGGGAGKFSFSDLPPVAFACIDEAHCVSEWSHHFRPSYLRVCKVLKDRLGVKCFLGLTATATAATANNVADHLDISDHDDAVIRGAPVPKNLQLSVSKDRDKEQALIHLLEGERFGNCYSVIIYCTRREETERLATLIRIHFKDDPRFAPKKTGKAKKAPEIAECYHAGLQASRRSRVQKAFMSGKLRIVAATVAFGMGLDKSDVRAVIHYNIPRSFESYVQEIGRAGRDGLESHCHLFLEPEGRDMAELQKHIHANTVDRVVVKKLVRKVFQPCKCRQLAENCQNEMSEEDFTVTNKRICPGHERAIDINTTVNELDMKEEGIATLLIYLELHEKRWIENMRPVYGTCKLQCYGGPKQLQEIAKKCPPVAIAIALEKRRGVSHTQSTSIEFGVIDVSDMMGWDSGLVKRNLKQLCWNMTPDGPRRSGAIVELLELCFHIRSPGDLSDEEMDEVTDYLYRRVTSQEYSQINQLQYLYEKLASVSHKAFFNCSEQVDEVRSNKLKETILVYFDHSPLPDSDSIKSPTLLPLTSDVECHIRSDVRNFINIYRDEHSLTGRAIARIFHGIGSPCFPIETWCRVRRFWRCHLNSNFNQIRKIATEELIKMR